MGQSTHRVSWNSRREASPTCERMTLSRSRWRWHFLALIPGLLSDLLFASVLLVGTIAQPSSLFAENLVLSVLFVGFCVPISIPIYLYFVGRSYVRIVHAGLKSVLPFVLLYLAANLALWLCGFVLVGSQMNAHR